MAESPFERRQNAGRIGASGRRSEKLTAGRLGAQLTAASGALGEKGDMKLPGFLLEAKSTVSASMRVEHGWLEKLVREADMLGKKPALTITFCQPGGRPRRDGKWVLITEVEYVTLTRGETTD